MLGSNTQLEVIPEMWDTLATLKFGAGTVHSEYIGTVSK